MDEQTTQTVAPKQTKIASYPSEEAIEAQFKIAYQPGIYRNTTNGVELLMDTKSKAGDIRMLPDWEFVRPAKPSDYKDLIIDYTADIDQLKEQARQKEEIFNKVLGRLWEVEQKVDKQAESNPQPQPAATPKASTTKTKENK